MPCFQLRLGDAVAQACLWLARRLCPCAGGRPAGVQAVAAAPPAAEAEARRPSAQQASVQAAGGQSLTLLQARAQARLLEAQAAKLKATIRRRGSQGESGPILGHYERVLAGLEGEIASLGAAAGPPAAA
ncbi:unnamed protein product [Prorocentrum cordatum]|uniref:Uncharacterized protein n=1 Tax=Prorocentrum cordatum TaxID=2364126 RepID=A0ABN9VXK8_9DINO|nr:unnamed protein product [Polarella glacialis]